MAAKHSSAKAFIVILLVLGLIKSNILWIVPIWIVVDLYRKAKAYDSKPGPKRR